MKINEKIMVRWVGFVSFLISNKYGYLIIIFFIIGMVIMVLKKFMFKIVFFWLFMFGW